MKLTFLNLKKWQKNLPHLTAKKKKKKESQWLDSILLNGQYFPSLIGPNF